MAGENLNADVAPFGSGAFRMRWFQPGGKTVAVLTDVVVDHENEVVGIGDAGELIVYPRE